MHWEWHFDGGVLSFLGVQSKGTSFRDKLEKASGKRGSSVLKVLSVLAAKKTEEHKEERRCCLLEIWRLGFLCSCAVGQGRPGTHLCSGLSSFSYFSENVSFTQGVLNVGRTD